MRTTTLWLLISALAVCACDPGDERADGGNTGASDAGPELGEVWAHRVERVGASRTYVADLASALGLVRAEQTTEGATTVVRSGARTLVVYATGAFDYTDESKLWNASYDTMLRTNGEAEELARDLLSEHGWLPEEAVFRSAEPVEVRGDEESRTINHYRVTFGLDAPLGSQAVAGSAVVSGVEIIALVGNGELLGLYWHWLRLVPDRRVPVRPRAEMELEARALAGDPTMELGAPTPFYRVVRFDDPDPLALLWYHFPVPGGADDGHPHRHVEGGLLVAATALTTSAEITAASAEEGGAVTLEASVRGGEPPYEYGWDIVGARRESLLAPRHESTGTGQVLSTQLEPGSYTVRLRVADRNGTRAEVLEVLEVPGEPAPEPPIAATVTGIGNDPVSVSRNGWWFTVRVTEHDGLEISNARIHGAPVLYSMMMPYYFVQTGSMARTACDLTHPSPVSTNCRAGLAWPPQMHQALDGSFVVEATYSVTALPAGPCSGRMRIDQVYVFRPARTGCAPGDYATCYSFQPSVTYSYTPPTPSRECPAGSNDLVAFEAMQRFDADVGGVENRAAFYRDDDLANVIVELGLPDVVSERIETVVRTGRRAGTYDNYHQRSAASQVFIPGCTTPFEPALRCMHNHWRWGANLIGAGSSFGGGTPLVSSDQQSVRVAVVRARSSEREPPGPSYDVAHLVNGESVQGRDMAFWVLSRSTARSDSLSDRVHMFFR